MRMPVTRYPITDRSEWLDRRRQDVTAHDVGALFGVHPYKTVYGLFHEKRGLALNDTDTPFKQRGRDLEPIIVKCLQRRHPDWEFQAANEYLRDDEFRLGCSPDVYARVTNGIDAVCQLKVVSSWEWKRRWSGGVPPEWILLQNLTELHLTNAKFGLIVPFDVDAWDIRDLYRVDRFPDVENEIAVRAASFMLAVVTGQEPKADWARDAGTVAARWPVATVGKSVDLTGDNRAPELCRDYLDVGDKLSNLKTQQKAIAAELQAKIGDAEIAQITGYEVTFKTINRRGYTVKPTSYRQLSVDSESEP